MANTYCSDNVAAPRLDWRAYLELCKPRVVALMILTSAVGMHLALPGQVPWAVLLWGNLGIALAAGAAAVINHLVDQRIDTVMARTHRRPLPSGRVSPQRAVLFALMLGSLSMGILVYRINVLTAVTTLLTLVGYAGFYTVYLKRATPQNIVIGGAAGAAPPLLGWVAATGHLDPGAWLLMLIIFVWTPPHFWALALYRYDDYAKVGIPMLPVTHGKPFTRICIFLYTLLLLGATLLPFAIGMSGMLYLAGSLALNSVFVYYTWKLWRQPSNALAIKTFRYSIVYLMLLFIVLLVDHYWLLAPSFH